jgi:hypothetical protein
VEEIEDEVCAAEELNGSEPEVLALAGTEKKKTQDDQADDGAQEGVYIKVDIPDSLVLHAIMLLLSQQIGVPGETGEAARPTANIAGPDRRVPDPQSEMQGASHGSRTGSEVEALGLRIPDEELRIAIAGRTGIAPIHIEGVAAGDGRQ